MANDHLFISYAWANAAFVDWLAMRLTAEGYKVWVDRHKLQGGQNWVNEIDNAIKTQSCRLFGVVSSASLARPAPQGEWQLAMSLSKQLPNFFMPLLLEPLNSTQLPFNLQVTQYTPFHEGWATGLRQLLKYLCEQGVPKDQVAGFREVGRWRPATARGWVACQCWAWMKMNPVGTCWDLRMSTNTWVWVTTIRSPAVRWRIISVSTPAMWALC